MPSTFRRRRISAAGLAVATAAAMAGPVAAQVNIEITPAPDGSVDGPTPPYALIGGSTFTIPYLDRSGTQVDSFDARVMQAGDFTGGGFGIITQGGTSIGTVGLGPNPGGIQIGNSACTPSACGFGVYNLQDFAKLTTSGIALSSGGTFNQRDFTSATVTDSLFLGMTPGLATYNLGGGLGLPTLTSKTVEIGTGVAGSIGQFVQESGSHSTTDLFIGKVAGGTGSYEISSIASTLTVDHTLAVGYDGTGSFSQQTGAVVTVHGNLVLGSSSGASGTYTLGAGSLSTASTTVGFQGTGAFTQDGGTHAVTTTLSVGANSTYTLNGGTLTADRLEAMQPGAAFAQTGGSAQFNSAAFTGQNLGASATLTVGGGSFSVGSGNLVVGLFDGAGQVTQTAGSVSVGSALLLGGGNTTSSYALSGGTLSAQSALVGNATLTQTGGGVAIAGQLTLDGANGATGAVSVQAGTLSAGKIVVGDIGSGSFEQTGGTVTTDSLVVSNRTGNGSYSLTGGTLNVGAGNESIGGQGVGSFGQSGGSNTVASGLLIGVGQGGTGSYTMESGSVSAGSASIGVGATGSLTMTGGSFSAGAASVGGSGGTAGTGTVDASNAAIAITGTLTIGANGSGAFTQAGGTTTVGALVLGGSSGGGSGTYTLNGGSLAAGSETVGQSGHGTISQTGGSNAVTGALVIGTGFSGNGSYSLGGGGTLSAGSLTIGQSSGSGGLIANGSTITVAGALTIGDGGTGTLTQFAGSTGAASLVVGGASGGIGNSTYTFNGGPTGLLTITGNETIGGSSGGSFVQNGGRHTIGGTLTIGADPNAMGAYQMNNGRLIVADEVVGGNGAGSFVQSNGNHSVTNTLTIGGGTGFGSYSLSGAQSKLSAGQLVIGNGEMTQSGGTVVADVVVKNGDYQQSGGSFTGKLTVGSGGNGNFIAQGGTHHVTGTLLVGDQQGGQGIYAAIGSAVGTIDGGVTVGSNGASGLFVQSGATVGVGGDMTVKQGEAKLGYLPHPQDNAPPTFTLNPGDAAVLTVAGAFKTLEGGTLSQGGGSATVGSADNRGTMAIAAGRFTATGDVTNTGAITIGANDAAIDGGPNAARLSVGGTFTQNAGSTLLHGGTIAAANGFVLNGGLFGGMGTVEGSVTNNGATLQVGASPDTLHIVGDYIQHGGKLLLEVVGDGHGGFLHDTLLLDPGATLLIDGAEIDLAFTGGADPYSFLQAGLFDLDTFIELAGGGKLDLAADFLGDTFVVTSDDAPVPGIAFDPVRGGRLVARDVPEPPTLALLGAGMLGAFLLRRRRLVRLPRIDRV